jgi:hypothetical protein
MTLKGEKTRDKADDWAKAMEQMTKSFSETIV